MVAPALHRSAWRYALLVVVRKQEVHSVRETTRPFSMTFTFCTLTLQRRRVDFLDQGRLLPYCGLRLQLSHFAMMASSCKAMLKESAVAQTAPAGLRLFFNLNIVPEEWDAVKPERWEIRLRFGPRRVRASAGCAPAPAGTVGSTPASRQCPGARRFDENLSRRRYAGILNKL